MVGYEGLYEVSDLGRVRSLARAISFEGRWGVTRRAQPAVLLRPSVNTSGYWKVTLWREGAYTQQFVHKIVLYAFVGPRPPKQQACHGAAGRDENGLFNLRWDTPSANQRDREVHGVGRIGRPSAITGRVSSETVVKIRSLAEHLNKTQVARALQLPRTTVADIINGRTRRRV